MVKVREIVDELNKFAPENLAEDWDPIGLAFGSYDQVVEKAMVALDLDEDTIDEAIANNIDFIITHHPPIFQAYKTWNAEDPRRRQYLKVIQNNISVYSLHTNLDAAQGGMNDWLADAIGMSADRQIIQVTDQEELYKLITFVPKSSRQQVIEALFASGAGQIGDYDDVYYRSNGFGNFKPGENSNPTIGNIGTSEKVEEEKLEVLLKKDQIPKAISNLISAHPYEEPTYDLFKESFTGDKSGFGRVGELAQELTADELADKVLSTFEVEGLRFNTNNPDKKHKRVGIFGGSGSDAYKQAKDLGATIYITGDISYHKAQDMLRDGIDFIDGGHYMEQIMARKLAEKIEKWNEELSWEIDVTYSMNQKDIYKYL